MASIQESLRAALAADLDLLVLVGDRIYPGEVPNEETPTPWLFYMVPESVPMDCLDASPIDVQSEVEFHALADTYAEAKAITDRVSAVLDAYSAGVISRALWSGTSEETTEEGYHHAIRFKVWWTLSVG